jgi:UDP-GlcNAc:undecaprenyl-phosphate/decaprenyl-phosphate GlcNAc-1-phosphate transferase
MIPLIGSIITALAVSVFTFPILIKYSERKRILDIPGHRRIHKRVTPSIGGVAIFIGFLVTVVIWLDFVEWSELRSIIGILFLTFVLGLCDDLVHIKPYIKLLGQVVAGSLVFFLLNVKISSTYGLIGDHQLPGLLTYLVTIFVIVIITNSFNLIDGIDGLAGSFSTVSLVFYGAWFFMLGDLNYAVLCFALTGAIAAFLIFNWEPSKIFMGDTGALLIGMMLSILTINFLNMNEALPPGSPYKFTASVSTALSVIIVPILDTTRIIIIRLSKGVSPMKADKRHIHHYLVRLGLRHQQAVFILLGVHLIYITLALVFSTSGNSFLLPVMLIISIVLSFILDGYFLRKVSQ